MNPIEAVRLGILRAFEFSGTASRAEFWWFVVFYYLVLICTDLLLNGIFGWVPLGQAVLLGGVSVGLLIPAAAVGARRLHQVGISGWWQLMGLSIVGLLPLIVLWSWPARDTASSKAA